MLEQRVIYYPDMGYLEIHLNAEGAWDYTFYSECLQEIDGGIIANDNPFIGSAVQEACWLLKLPHSQGQPLDYETFDTILFGIERSGAPW